MKNREIELKYVTTMSFEAVVSTLKTMIEAPLETYAGLGTDYLWNVATYTPYLDMLRVRQDTYGHGELTAKKKDGTDNFNRKEYNVPIFDAKTAVSMFTDLYGEPIEFTKRSAVYISEDEPDIVFSCYEILGNNNFGTFIEVEGIEETQVLAYGTQLFEVFRRLGAYIRKEPRSLYEIIVLEHGSQDGLTKASDIAKKVVPLRRRT